METKNQIDGLVALAVAYAVSYQVQHDLPRMHPEHQDVLRSFLSDDAKQRLGFTTTTEPTHAD